MGLRIATNVSALNAQRMLETQQSRAEHALSALASGSRIVNASDDAAGLAISENLRGQISGLKVARQNSNNAISLVQVSEGGLNEITNILIRLRELGVQAASDNISDTERGFLNSESTALVQEIDRIAETTQFGNTELLNGSGERFEFQVGAFAGDENIISYDIEANATAGALGVDGVSLEDRGSARGSLQSVDDSLVKVSEMRANFGAVQSRLQKTTSNLDIQIENISAANSRIRDADVAHESAELASAQVLQSAAVGVMAQANSLPAQALRLLN